MKKILTILLLFPALCYSQIDGKIKGNISGGIQSSISNKYKLASSPPVYYGDYFVSNSGDDSYPGTSADSAWQTTAKISSEFSLGTFLPGDTISFKKGDVWSIDNVFEITGCSGSSGDPIVLDGGLWGTGSNAIIRANSDGGANPKYYSLCHLAACDYITLRNLTFDGNEKIRHGLIIGGADGTYGPTAQNDERFITVEDCDIVRVAYGPIAGTWYAFLIASWHNDMYNITIQRNYVDSVSHPGICFYNGRTDLGAEMTTIHNTYVGYNEITNCGLDQSIGSNIIFKGDYDSTVVEHNIITQGVSGTVPGFTCECDTSLSQLKMHVRYNEIRMTTAQAMRLSGLNTDSAGVLDYDIYYNLLVADTSNSAQGSVRLVSFKYDTDSEINFFNNTITFGDGWGGAYLSCPIPNIVTFRNNIVRGDGYLLGWGSGSADITHDHNSYYNSKSGDPGYAIDEGIAVTKSNIVTWEPTATITDPLFVTEFTDLHLQNGSPCINAGINIPTIPQFDFEGTAVADPPEIGAYEK